MSREREALRTLLEAFPRLLEFAKEYATEYVPTTNPVWKEGWFDKLQAAARVLSEPATIYTLTCDKCGQPYDSKDGFPGAQVCPKCADPHKEARDALEAVKSAVGELTFTSSEPDDWILAVLVVVDRQLARLK